MKLDLQNPILARTEKSIDALSWSELTGEEIITLDYRKIRNAIWELLKIKNKFAIYMNGKLQRLFSEYDEAEIFFDIWSEKY